MSGYIAEKRVIDVKKNASFIVKGILTNKLMSVFKQKDYIINQLKEERLSPSITLAEFYKVSKRKILLNFPTINANQQRLTFINKNLMPNMPIWAAILATSSLPLFHDHFAANQEWEAPDSESFCEYFVNNFFQAFQDKNQRITSFTSGNIVSSLPLELLLNNTIQKNIFKDDVHENLN